MQQFKLDLSKLSSTNLISFKLESINKVFLKISEHDESMPTIFHLTYMYEASPKKKYECVNYKKKDYRRTELRAFRR